MLILLWTVHVWSVITDVWILPISVQTLGLSHALTSFMWLCGPIAGLVVSTGTNRFYSNTASALAVFFSPTLLWYLSMDSLLLPCRFNRWLACTVIGLQQDGEDGGHLSWQDVCSSALLWEPLNLTLSLFLKVGTAAIVTAVPCFLFLTFPINVFQFTLCRSLLLAFRQTSELL